MHIGLVWRRVKSCLHSGLGQLEHYPGAAFVCALTAKCSEHGLQALKPLELSGLIGVSSAALPSVRGSQQSLNYLLAGCV
jgi:hypothetical protein